MRLNQSALMLALTIVAALGMLVPSTGDAVAHEQLKGKTYYFGTSEPRTNISFVSDADIEFIQGTTNKMDAATSQITVDASGKQASGLLRVDVGTLQTGIALRDEHLRSAMWLDAKKYPWITLKLDEIVEGKDGRTWTYKGKLTIKGVTKSVSGEVRVMPIPTTVKGLGAGEWVRVRAKFDVDLHDFGVNIPQNVVSKVNRVWKISVDIYGTTAAPKSVQRR